MASLVPLTTFLRCASLPTRTVLEAKGHRHTDHALSIVGADGKIRYTKWEYATMGFDNSRKAVIFLVVREGRECKKWVKCIRLNNLKGGGDRSMKTEMSNMCPKAHEEAGLAGWESGSGIIGDPADQMNSSRKIMKVLECWAEGFDLVP